jgi:hypothetical protein
MHDPIIEEIRRIRDEHAAQFNYDLHAICEDLRKEEELSGRTYIRLPPRKAVPSRRWRRLSAPVEEQTSEQPQPS